MHEHSGGTCPITGNNAFCPPQKGDLRSVCPALNAMANHGFIPRDGRNLTFFTLFHGLKACYGLSSSLATVLVTGGFLAIGRLPIHIPFVPGGVIDLHLVGLHNRVEHDASLVHLNTPLGHKYGPVEIQEEWVPMLVNDIQPPTLFNSPEFLTTFVDEADVGRMRARRQHDILPKKLDPVHAEVARGEMAIILGVWNSEYQRKHEGKQVKGESREKQGIPLQWLLQWLAEERLPDIPISSESKMEVDGDSDIAPKKTTMWRPNHKQTLRDVVNRSKRIRKVTEAIESGEAKL
ncbi:Chloroperoxidase [Lentinula detonsa]|uniref:Chloroperoxidase n=1 Tax=Lentinula detonsa TaxID=2804962 RepID=A0A9W8P4N8_9AGAR|nr:Chloroperoxidase [Lentinula detonsa]